MINKNIWTLLKTVGVKCQKPIPDAINAVMFLIIGANTKMDTKNVILSVVHFNEQSISASMRHLRPPQTIPLILNFKNILAVP